MCNTQFKGEGKKWLVNCYFLHFLYRPAVSVLFAKAGWLEVMKGSNTDVTPDSSHGSGDFRDEAKKRLVTWLDFDANDFTWTLAFWLDILPKPKEWKACYIFIFDFIYHIPYRIMSFSCKDSTWSCYCHRNNILLHTCHHFASKFYKVDFKVIHGKCKKHYSVSLLDFYSIWWRSHNDLF